jgi:hypothetical protein
MNTKNGRIVFTRIWAAALVMFGAALFCTVVAAPCYRASAGSDCDTNNPADPCYRVHYPNGGETVYIGDTMRIVASSYYEGGGAGLSIMWGRYELSLQSMLDVGGNINPYTDTVYKFLVPDSFYIPFYDTVEKKIAYEPVSSISSQCKIKLFDYNSPSIYDVSDAYFTIAARPAPAAKKGCGSGFGLALIVPVGLLLRRRFPAVKKHRG